MGLQKKCAPLLEEKEEKEEEEEKEEKEEERGEREASKRGKTHPYSVRFSIYKPVTWSSNSV